MCVRVYSSVYLSLSPNTLPHISLVVHFAEFVLKTCHQISSRSVVLSFPSLSLPNKTVLSLKSVCVFGQCVMHSVFLVTVCVFEVTVLLVTYSLVCSYSLCNLQKVFVYLKLIGIHGSKNFLS